MKANGQRTQINKLKEPVLSHMRMGAGSKENGINFSTEKKGPVNSSMMVNSTMESSTQTIQVGEKYIRVKTAWLKVSGTHVGN